jgi:hypothetical protein
MWRDTKLTRVEGPFYSVQIAVTFLAGGRKKTRLADFGLLPRILFGYKATMAWAAGWVPWATVSAGAAD